MYARVFKPWNEICKIHIFKERDKRRVYCTNNFMRSSWNLVVPKWIYFYFLNDKKNFLYKKWDDIFESFFRETPTFLFDFKLFVLSEKKHEIFKVHITSRTSIFFVIQSRFFEQFKFLMLRWCFTKKWFWNV